MPNTPRVRHSGRQVPQSTPHDHARQPTSANGGNTGGQNGKGFASWLTRSGGEGPALLGAAAIIVVTLVLTMSDAVTSLQRARDLSRVAVTSSKVDNLYRSYEVRGRDSNGASALFEIIVSNRSIAWMQQAAGTLERDGTPLEPDRTLEAVFSERLIARLSASPVLIAVGNAPALSDNGQRQSATGSKAKVAAPAQTMARARAVAGWLKQAIPGDKTSYTLDLGRSTGNCERCETAETSWQRPLILIGVREIDDGVDLRQALLTALARTRNLPSPTDFSRFELKLFPS